MSIQKAIANDYYRLVDDATTPQQINVLKQHVAQSVQRGNLPAYEGVPLIGQLDSKLKDYQDAAAMRAGLVQPPVPIAQRMLASAQAPQAPQGIDAAPSNLPQQYAGGGIVAFANEGQVKAPTTEMYEDPTSGEVYERPVSTGRSALAEWADRLKAKAHGTYVAPTAPAVAPSVAPAPEAPKGNGIVIHDTPSPRAPARQAAPAAAPESTTAEATGIDKLLESGRKNREDLKALIMGDKEDRQNQLVQNVLLAAMKGGFETAAGTSPWATANIGRGGASAAEGIAQAVAQANADKNRQVSQLVALGLKGEELDTELAKLGITKEHYADQKKLMDAQAGYYRSRGAAAGSGGTGGKGSVSSAVVQSELNNMEGYKANPTSAPFFKSLPADVQMALTKTAPETASYQRGLQVFNQYLSQYTQNRLDTMRAYGAKAAPSPYAIE